MARWFALGAVMAGVTACGGSAEEGADEQADAAVSCGGELIGFWGGQYLDHRPEPKHDPCHELNPTLEQNGYIHVGLSYTPPDQRQVSFEFREDATFTGRSHAYGQAQQSYAAACLSTGSVTLTCEQLTSALASTGGGEGGIGNVECIASTAATGGCDCTWGVAYGYPDFGTGTWTVSDARLTLMVEAPNTPTTTIAASYCVENDQLRFSAAVDRLVPGVSTATLTATR